MRRHRGRDQLRYSGRRRAGLAPIGVVPGAGLCQRPVAQRVVCLWPADAALVAVSEGRHIIWPGRDSESRLRSRQLPPASTARVPRGGYLKFPWWRMISGRLTITGHPVGARRPHLTASIPAAYGDGGFQATGLHFPKYGCWRVTGHLQGYNPSFVLKVARLTAHRP